jgi:hypothetical protein
MLQAPQGGSVGVIAIGKGLIKFAVALTSGFEINGTDPASRRPNVPQDMNLAVIEGNFARKKKCRQELKYPPTPQITWGFHKNQSCFYGTVALTKIFGLTTAKFRRVRRQNWSKCL